MSALRFSPIAAVLLLLTSNPSLGQTAPTNDAPTITLRGIVSGTVFAEDALFTPGNGQQSLFVTQEQAQWWHGGDIRSTRLAVDFSGPAVIGDWKVGATVEGDFFGPFAAAGAFGDEQPTPRLRLAYVDLSNGRTTLRIGQDWSLTLGNIPVSTSHIGFPFGWGSGGFIGWRFPGIFLRHMLTRDAASVNSSVRFAVMRGSWSDEPVADLPSAGEQGSPQLETRLDLDGRMKGGSTWQAYAVGHYDHKDLSGSPDLSGWAGEAGARFASGNLTLQGNAHISKGLAQQFAQILQFGDIQSWGAWAQAGITLSRHWSLWLYGGMEDPEDADVLGSVVPADQQKLKSVWLVPMIRFNAGGYSLGLEWAYNNVDYVLAPVERTGNQILLSVRYDFSIKFTVPRTAGLVPIHR